MEQEQPHIDDKVEYVGNEGLSVMLKAEIDVQIATAKQYPRSVSKAKSDMLSMATLDEETARGCFYTLPRGGKSIQGPSVRLAEIAVSSWGNIRCGSRIQQVVTSGDNPHVVVQAVAHDLERNIAVTIEKRRRLVGKKDWKHGMMVGHKPIDDDDIQLAVNAATAIAFRDAVFKVVPLVVVKSACDAAKKVAVGDAKTLATRRAAAVEAFGKMGVVKDRVLLALKKRSVEDITLEDLEILIGLHNSIRDGDTTIEEAFPERREESLVAEAPKEETKPDPRMQDPEADFGPMPHKPESPPTAEPIQPPEPSPVQKLGQLLQEWGHSFDTLVKWCKHTGNYEQADSCPSIEEFPVEIAARLIKAKVGLKRGLDQVSTAKVS